MCFLFAGTTIMEQFWTSSCFNKLIIYRLSGRDIKIYLHLSTKFFLPANDWEAIPQTQGNGGT